MPRGGNILSGAITGGSTAGQLSGYNPYITAAGAIGGGLIGLFSESEEEKRQKRRAELLKQLAEFEAIEKGEARKDVQSNLATVQQGTARRLAAAGIGGGNEESFLLSANQNVIGQGNDVLDNISRDFRQKRLAIETDFADRPLEPEAVDYFTELAPTVANAYGGYKYQQALDKFVSGQQTTPPNNFTSDVKPQQSYGYTKASGFTPYARRRNQNPLFNY